MARPAKVDLSAYHADILAWDKDGKSRREIADLLKHHYEISVTRDQVRNYLEKQPTDPQGSVPASKNLGTAEASAEPSPTPQAAPASAVVAQKPLSREEQLRRLREQGVLTAEEYEKLTQAAKPPPTTPPVAAAPAADASPQALAPLRKPPRRNVLPPAAPPTLPFVALPAPPLWTPDLSILDFGHDQWTLRDACEGTLIMGATGSGKTSGSGRTLAHAFLSADFGGLVLCVKQDEARLWQHYAEVAGRSEQLCIVRPGGPLHFNFLNYECRRPGVGLDWIENITQLFRALMEVYVPNQRDSQDPFWITAPNQLIRSILRVFAFAQASVSLEDIVRFLEQAPTSMEAVESGSWRGTDWFGPLLEEAIRMDEEQGGTIEIAQARRYWLSEYPAMPGRTRASLVTVFSSMVDGLFSSEMERLFFADTTIVPEMAELGAIIVIDLPLHKRDMTGLLAQRIWKYFFQKAVERREEPPNPSRRPVFLWADEAQFHYSDYDALFQSTARSSSCATVYLTQNITNFYGIHGGNRDKINGFFGNLNTKIFHANNDVTSNQWAADQIGKSMQYRSSVQHSDNPTKSGSVTTSPQMDYNVQPAEFMQLRTGGEENGFEVDAYFCQSGATFSNGTHYFRTTFVQET